MTNNDGNRFKLCPACGVWFDTVERADVWAGEGCAATPDGMTAHATAWADANA